MTLTYKLGLDILKRYLSYRNEVCRSSLSEVTAQTETDVIECVTTAIFPADNKKIAV